MKRLSLILVVVALLASCKDGAKEVSNQEQVTTKDTLVSSKRDKLDSLDTPPSPQLNKHESDHEINGDERTNKTSSSTTKEKQATTSTPPPPENVIEEISRQAKPPKINRTINWKNDYVVIKYIKKVFPDPDIGCTASDEEFSIKIPVSKREEKQVFGTADLQNSELNYAYSGGMYGESSNGSPTSGTIKIDQTSDEKWNIEINIEFPVEVMGDMDQQEKQKRFELSGVFQ